MGVKKILSDIKIEVKDINKNGKESKIGEIHISGTKLYVYKKGKKVPSKKITLKKLIEMCEKIDI